MIFALALTVAIINLLILALVAWNALAWPPLKPVRQPAEDAGEECSILIPARNEAHNLADCLEAALAQGPCVREVIVCDDHSSDATVAIARRFARLDPRVRLIGAPPLADGWSGKSWACLALAQAAEGRWLLFIDADVRLAEGAAAAMIAAARRRRASFLSCWPGLALGGFWERALMPLLNFVVFTLHPAPLALRRTDPSLGLAHGACILARAGAYHRLGGHRLVPGEMFEDTALARAWRAGGERAICLDGSRIVSVRMYDSLPAIWQGFKKIFRPAFRRQTSFWLFFGFHGTCFLLPFVALPFVALPFAGGAWPFWLAAGAVLAMRALQAWRFGYPAWAALLHPPAQALLLANGLASWWALRSGSGVEWKGRTYHARPRPDPLAATAGKGEFHG